MKHIPNHVLNILNTLKSKGFQANIVGGSVRDLLLGKTPKDWDINTNATPDQILSNFPDSFYENDFGTVGVKVNPENLSIAGSNEELLGKVGESEDNKVEIIEVTPYRKEGKYLDGRRPTSVDFTATLEEDLRRRDFTVNAIALDPIEGNLYYLDYNSILIKDNIKDMDLMSFMLKDIDIHKGHSLSDLQNRLIRAVGNPKDRFNEDSLRMLRAVRFCSQLGFSIEESTLLAIKDSSANIKLVSRERVRDEFSKLIMSKEPMVGIEFLRFTGLIGDVMPELLLGLHMKQTVNHKYDVYQHLLHSLQHAADKDYTLELRLAALLHDIAKPHTMRKNGNTGWNSFHGHEVVGAKVSREILNRLNYSKELVSRVTKLVRWHMFNSDPDQVTMSAVRRMVMNVGRENIWDLMNLRFCDRIGSGRPLEEPHRLRRYFAMIEQALVDPIDLKMLNIDGNKIMDVTHETPGPRLRYLLYSLFGEVLENSSLNNSDYLVSRVTELAKMETEQLVELAKKGATEQEEEQEKIVKSLKKKHRV